MVYWHCRGLRAAAGLAPHSGAMHSLLRQGDFPAYDQDEAQSMEQTVKHVLLVEDNAAHARLIRAHLEDFIGLTVDWVQRGEEALDYLSGQGSWENRPLPDLILLDLKLPGMHGPEVLHHLKTEERLRRIPVVVLTTSRDSADMDEAYAEGANSYLVKSADFTSMQQMLHNAIAFWCEWNQFPRNDQKPD